MNENKYVRLGYDSQADYYNFLAEVNGVPLSYVISLADLLGEGEDFDGLVVAVEDAGCRD